MHDIHVPAFVVRKEIIVGTIFFIIGALLFVAYSTVATTIGTNATITGSLFATSTIQATGNILGYSDLILGTTTPWKGADYAFEQQTGTQPVFLVGDTGTSTPHFVINAKGWVGIGTASPRKNLSVNGSIAVYNGTEFVYTPSTTDIVASHSTANSRFIAGQSTSKYAAFVWNYNATVGDAYATINMTGNTDVMTFLQNGNIGIGTTSPGSFLSVENTGSLNSFWIGDAANDATPFVIDPSGNVGIGTTSPASLLSLSSSATTTIHIGTTSSTQGSCFQMYSPNHTAYRLYISNAGAVTVQAGSCE